jgi:hypothetical protein
MSTGFYSLVEAQERTGKSEDELRGLVKRGAINTIEDDDQLWLSAADVDDLRPNKKRNNADAAAVLDGEEDDAKGGSRAEPEIDITEVPIALEPEEDDSDGMSKIKSLWASGISARATSHDTSHLKRQLLEAGKGATRCRTFHSKLNDPSLANMDERINEWVDSSDNMVIKFATTTVGIIEGKHAEPHLIVTVFY